MDTKICPLCLNSDVIFQEKLSKEKLQKHFKKFCGNRFGYLINEDFELLKCTKCSLKFFFPLVTGDELFYNTLQKFDWYYVEDKEEYIVASRYINKNDKILDIGCGKGAFSKKIKSTNYVGLDFSVEAQRIASKNKIKVLNETIKEHTESNTDYDVIVNFQVLEHVSNPRDFISSSLKGLKKNGLMIIAVPNDDSFIKYANNNVLNMPPHHVSRWNEGTLNFIAKDNDLEIVDIYYEKVQPIHEKWYFATLIAYVLFKKFRIKYSLLSKSFMEAIVIKTSNFLSRFASSISDKSLLPNGHSVVAVYKKKL